MNIVLPILFGAVVVGLFAPARHEKAYRRGLGVWIALVILYYYIKH